jgi:hypothetical protein
VRVVALAQDAITLDHLGGAYDPRRVERFCQAAARLVISEKTVDNHIPLIYNKIGASTHASATLFAMENDLLADESG